MLTPDIVLSGQTSWDKLDGGCALLHAQIHLVLVNCNEEESLYEVGFLLRLRVYE